MSLPVDTIAALATPVGTSAIAVLRVSGPDTKGIAAAILGKSPLPRSVRRADYRDAAGVLIDDVLLTFFSAPRSYTGEDSLEISSHGSPYVAQRILEDLFARGCRPAEPGEFTLRAFLNGRMDLSQAEAVMDLIHARSERALAVANQQLRGALGARMRELIDAVLGALARIEAYIDFPEEDLPSEDRATVVAALDEIDRGTERLLATSHYGELLREGIKTVLIGEPNAGKSSLLNRLLGRERAIVSAEPGTTRDFIEESFIVGAHRLRLTDTAGLNPAPGAIERLGIDKTAERLREADLVLWVVDATKPRPALPSDLAACIDRENTIVVLNKSDLLPAAEPAVDASGVRVSALTGAGISQLVALIERKADVLQPAVGDEVVAINARHARSLTHARECLAAARAKLIADGPVELLASDLRGVLDALGEISGKIDNEKMLDQLFATFCIGK
jgi:tRNA modification GTPase